MISQGLELNLARFFKNNEDEDNVPLNLNSKHTITTNSFDKLVGYDEFLSFRLEYDHNFYYDYLGNKQSNKDVHNEQSMVNVDVDNNHSK